MPAAHRRDSHPAFLVSMPPRYRELFDGAAAREHAAIAARREGAPAHVELWRRLPKGGAVVCVVADDRPGLLSFISAALVVHCMDVEAVQAYTREGCAEAFDLFWLQREGGLPSPILDADIARIRDVLGGLVTGSLSIDGVAREARARRAHPPGATTRVAFEENSDAGLVVLTVETFDRPGLLLVITRALFRARVQIIASEASTRDGRVVDRFTIVEFDGAPVRGHRRGVLQVEVLAAIDALARGAS